VSTFLLVLGLTSLGGLGGLLVASSVLLIKEPARSKLIPWLVSYAVGALLGASMLEILPKALEELSAREVFPTLLLGILLFFVLEKLVLWRHCHTHDCEVHDGAVLPVVVGDAFHNFVDGAVIAAAAMTSLPLGITTAVAVTAHEIPQEVGDFAILLHAGYSRGKALTLNALSALASIVGAIAAFFAFDHLPALLPYFLALSAASFLYVAMADLIPGLHRGRTDASSLRQILLFAAGVATMLIVQTPATTPTVSPLGQSSDSPERFVRFGPICAGKLLASSYGM
jgi:zinc and cadmium transporter